jgi:DNA gyrase subunit A
MEIERPDLSDIPQEVVDYIEALEAELTQLQPRSRSSSTSEPAPPEPSEPPTTLNIITVSQRGLLKRTPRHLFTRQRRGGMGVFDIELPEDDYPAFLTAADESQRLLMITNHARAFHMPLNRFPASELRSRGQFWADRIELEPGEHLAAVLPNPSQGYLGLVSENGYVRRLRHHVFGEYMKPGTSLLDLKDSGLLAAACITGGEGDIFIANQSGVAIRFPEKAIPPQGTLGIRLQSGDRPVAICGVKENSGVFLLGADGRGTIRLMSGFAANKAPGAGGKFALKTDRLVSACTISETEDLFIISHLSKIIRFGAIEIPTKEGVVQGVICMSLRADECTAATTGG